VLGRFITADKVLSVLNKMPNGQELVDPLSLNLYTYVHNNPIRYHDSSGHWVETVWDVFNIGLDVFDIGMDIYTGDYWSLLLDIPSLVLDGAAAAVPVVPGGIGMLKTPLRSTKTIKTFDKISSLINAGTKLDGFAKSFLRKEARSFMLKKSDNFAQAISKGTKLDVHHVVPLEWAHVMGKGFDPNMMGNLVGVDPKIHKEINKMWDQFRKDWKGKIPTVDDVMSFVQKVNDKYNSSFVR
jgi:hypothetical protein